MQPQLQTPASCDLKRVQLTELEQQAKRPRKADNSLFAKARCTSSSTAPQSQLADEMKTTCLAIVYCKQDREGLLPILSTWLVSL
eukprot:m.18384 g.18384  ORF g.18384 m.18384 type:complete len:85 (-) comp30081_c0_seq1:330-584(-)